MRWVRLVARLGGKRDAYRILENKSEEKILIRKPRCRWKVKLNTCVDDTKN